MTENNYSHIHPQFQSIADKPNEERIEFIDEPRWLGYPRAKEVHSLLLEMLHKTKRPRMGNLLIVGDSNNGKTTIVRRFCELHGKGYVNENDEPVRPIILAESPTTPDEKGLYSSILDCFFAPYRVSTSPLGLRNQAVHLLRECNVRMLFIDEIHSCLTGSGTKQKEVMNGIKYLCNTVEIPIVGVGLRESINMLHHDSQYASRFEVIGLPLWELDNSFQQLVKSFESILPLRKPSNLHSPKLCMKLHAISGGNIGDLHYLLTQSAKEAINSGRECIDLEILENLSWIQPSISGIRERP